MTFFYNLGISAYSLAIRLAAPFNEKASLLTKGRKESKQKIKAFKRKNERLVWFHAASLGEFEQGRPVMEALKREEPNTRILLTFFSPSGYEIRKNYKGADIIMYLPSDRPSNAQQFVETFKPDVAIFIKYEFWYNFLHELQKADVPTYLISAIFRKGQPFFQGYGSLYRKMLTFFKTLFVQDEESIKLLQNIHIGNAQRIGDTRFDRVKEIASAAKVIEKIEKFAGNAPLFIAGSSWGPDEDIIFDYINRYTGSYKWILAPHEIGENHIKAIMQRSKKPIVRYSDESADVASAEVLVIDCIGLLSSIYRYGKIAYIGGGFGVGIHNTVEAAVYGIPVIFGPNHQRFREALELLACHGGFTINDKASFCQILDTLTTDENVRATAGEMASNYVESQLGATPIIVNAIRKNG